MKKLKNLWFGAATLFLTSPILYASSISYTKPSNKDGGEKIVDSVDSIATILYNLLEKAVLALRTGAPFIAFACAILGWFMGNNYVKKKAEQNNGQEAPSVVRLGVPIVGAIAGVVITFVIIGILGKVFLGLTATESWDWAVTSVLGVAGGLKQ